MCERLLSLLLMFSNMPAKHFFRYKKRVEWRFIQNIPAKILFVEVEKKIGVV